MKLIVCFLILVVSSLAQARLTESAKEVTFELNNPKEARQVYQFLGLPLNWGDKVTGKPHQYKYFEDKAGAVSIYCDLVNSNARCLISIRKIESTDMTEVSHEGTESRAALYDAQDAETLFKALLVKPIVHGGYEMRALTDEAVNFSINCMKDSTNGTGTSCQVMIFKGNSI